MLRLNDQTLLKQLVHKARRFMRKPTIDEMQEMLANQPPPHDTRSLDFEPWRRTHPSSTNQRTATDEQHDFMHKQTHEQDDQQPRLIPYDETPHDFSKRFRKRDIG